jgi:hypothetical protein
MIIKIGLCQGQHEIPGITDYFFDTEISLINTIQLQKIAEEKLWKIMDIYGRSNIEIELYVTGLTAALIAVINACNLNCTRINLMHYDKNACTYYKQNIVQFSTTDEA